MSFTNVQVELNTGSGGIFANTQIASQFFKPKVEDQKWQSLLNDARNWRDSAERRKKISGYSGSPVHKEDAEMGGKILATILPTQESREALRRRLFESDDNMLFSVTGQDSDTISIPWETCSYPEWGMLNLDPADSQVQKNSNIIVLRMPVQLRDPRYRLDETIQIMTVASNPRDILPPNFVFEERNIDDGLRTKLKPDRYHLIPVENLNELDLKDRLKNDNPHILHIMAHGEGGKILAENTRGDIVKLDGRRLANIIGEIDSLEGRSKKLTLFVSTACELMQNASDALSLEVGPALAKIIPFTIGMQLPVLPEVAGLFSQEFYASVADSKPVIESFIHARQNLLDRYPGASSWIAPVLYVASSQDYVLFESDDALYHLNKISRELSEPIAAISADPENKPALKKTAEILADMEAFHEKYKKRSITARLDVSGELEKLMDLANKEARKNLFYLRKYVESENPEWFFDKEIPEKSIALIGALKKIRDKVDELRQLLSRDY